MGFLDWFFGIETPDRIRTSTAEIITRQLEREATSVPTVRATIRGRPSVIREDQSTGVLVTECGRLDSFVITQDYEMKVVGRDECFFSATRFLESFEPDSG